MAILIRKVSTADTEGVVSLYSRIHQSDPTVGAITKSEWDRFLRSPMNSEGKGFFLAEADGVPIGLATSSLRETHNDVVRHFRILVEPIHRLKGIGTSLLKRLIELDQRSSSIYLQCLCPSDWISGRLFLERHGFSLVESELFMRCDQASIIPMQHPVEFGFERVNEPARYASKISDLHNDAYKTDASFFPYSQKTMARLLEDGADLWLLRLHGETVGYAHLESNPQYVSIESLVVAKRFQRRGLGSWMIARLLSEIIVKSGRYAELEVSSRNTTAILLYEKNGFRRVAESYRFRMLRDVLENRLNG
jgi:ribosomal protein S18 acetylase RimI-like enzyme